MTRTGLPTRVQRALLAAYHKRPPHLAFVGGGLVTVCIAAVCRAGDVPVVVASSDRLITAGDVQFEPPVRKIYPLTNSVFALVAGDASTNVEVLDHARLDIRRRLSTNQSWMTVEEVADIVSGSVIRYRQKAATRTFLSPLGLSLETFISRQRDMGERWADRMTGNVYGYEANLSLVVAGVDESGAHVWQVDGMGRTYCNDSAGFAAIGIGQRHAESQFMFAHHASWKPFPETLLLTYAAKKRAEVAPGVGYETDMCVVGGLGRLDFINFEQIQYLENLYQAIRREQAEAAERANQTIAEHFRAIVSSQTDASSGAQAPETSVVEAEPGSQADDSMDASEQVSRPRVQEAEGVADSPSPPEDSAG